MLFTCLQPCGRFLKHALDGKVVRAQVPSVARELPMIIKIRKLNRTVLAAVLILIALPSIQAQAELGFGFEDEYQDNFEQALAELQPLAEAGDPKAQLWLGLMYYYGRGVPFNPRIAQDLIRKSANQLYQDGEFALCFIISSCFTGGTPNN